MGESDRTVAHPGTPYERSDAGPRRGSGRRRLATDGGEDRDRPLTDRSTQSIEDEIEELEQNPRQYETRDQAVIDRYEGLLAEQRRRQQTGEDDQNNQSAKQLRRVKDRFLRTLGLR